MTRKRNTIGAALLMALLVALTAGCGGGGGDKNAGTTARGDELTRVKLAYLGVASDAAMVLGRDKGFFKQEGIDLQLSRVGAGGAAVVPALLKGDVDVASGGIDGPILAAAKGLDVKILAANGAPISKGHTHPAGTKRGTTGIVVPADSPVRSYKDLAGKTVGAITVSGLQYLCVAGAVEKAGADPKSVRVVEIEAPDMLAEVKQHHVAAAAVVEPFLTQARRQGFRVIGDPCVAAMPGVQQAGFFTSGRWAKQNPEVVTRLARALTRSNEYANAHSDEVRAVIPSYTKIPPPAAQKLTLTPWDTSGRNTLGEVAADLVKYGLLKKQPDVDNLLVGTGT
jgi:NitT/TauT family transport system substrate-binding protein